MYTIEVAYQTGNSFNRYSETDTIGLVFKDKEQAREALRKIKGHYEVYKKLDTLWPTTKQVLSLLPEELEYLTIEEGESYNLFYLETECCDGSVRNIPVDMWCGYFESLHSAKIISLEDDGDSYVP